MKLGGQGVVKKKVKFKKLRFIKYFLKIIKISIDKINS
jgi:hypothetical protein